MSHNNRAAVLTKTHRVLKKYYKSVAPPSNRVLLEHLLYGCALESARHDQADEAFARLQQSYFDWNEVRVTTIAELAQVLAVLPDAPVAAKRLKRVLHHLFETHYAFDIEFYRKQNLGKAVKEIERLNGMTPFVLAYFTQNGLGGHAIPLSGSALQTLYLVGAITEKDVAKRKAPGLERAIAKSKGCEFGSVLHQLATDYAASPFSNRVRSIMLEIASDARDRFPKRAKKEEPAKKAAAKPAGKKAAAEKKPAKKAAAGKTTAKKADAKKPAAKKSTKKPAAKKKKADKKASAKKPVAKKPAAKKPLAKKTATKKTGKKSASKRLAKKKPR